jgi:succinate dehydrogenase / fumarate reductase flavoprotein subunit
VWVPKDRETAARIRKGEIKPSDVPEEERDYLLERKYPSFGNLAPRDISSRAAKEVCDEGRGVAPTGYGVFLDFSDAINRLGKSAIEERYGNLFDMYENISGTNAYEQPMQIYPAPHYTMGGLWVDYNLMTTIPGLFAAGECNFSDHGANRLGASALMQGLADGYFIVPYVIGNYLASEVPLSKAGKTDINSAPFDEAENAVREKIDRMLGVNGKSSPRSIHIELGKIMLDKCGMARSEEGLKEAIARIRELRQRFWDDVHIPGGSRELNIELERAGRVADHLEFAELMCHDALDRDESCGGHFRVEHQTEDGEAVRRDDVYANVSVWEFKGLDNPPEKHVEPLSFDNVKLGIRSYK